MFERKIKSEVSNAVSELKQELKQELKDSVEDICMQAMKEIFSNTRDRKAVSSYYHVYEIATVGGEFKERVIEAVGDDVTKKCTEAANDIVLGEEFIDSVVDRIKKKQIGK